MRTTNWLSENTLLFLIRPITTHRNKLNVLFGILDHKVLFIDDFDYLFFLIADTRTPSERRERKYSSISFSREREIINGSKFIRNTADDLTERKYEADDKLTCRKYTIFSDYILSLANHHPQKYVEFQLIFIGFLDHKVKFITT